MAKGWKAVLNGSTLCGGDCDSGDGCLLIPPDGLGGPDLNTEDVTYPQRDGVEHFSDWYTPRILTLTGLIGGTGCGCEGGARAAARNLQTAWGRACDDEELVLFTPCDGEGTGGPLVDGDVLYTNQCINPSLENDITNYHNTSSVALTRDTTTGGAFIGAASLLLTFNPGGGAAGGGCFFPASGSHLLPITHGSPYSVSWRMKGSTGGQPLLMRVSEINASGAVVTSHVTSNVVPTGSYQELRLQGLTASSTTADLIVAIEVAPGHTFATGSTVNMDAMIVSFTSTLPNTIPSSSPLAFLNPYYDGSLDRAFLDPVLGGIAYIWSGTVGESHSLAFEVLPSPDRRVVGPFGVRGRPRSTALSWRPGRTQLADALLRFDSPDQRLYVLDADGTPGSGTVCEAVTSAPTDPDYFVTALDNANHFWPLDAPNIGPPTGTFTQTATDLGATPVTGGDGFFNPAPALSYSLGRSAVGPGSTFTTPSIYTSYTIGLLGWWQEVSSDATAPGVQMSLDSTHWIGGNVPGSPVPQIKWGSGAPVTMDPILQEVFGFTSGIRDQPVLVLVTWSASAMEINISDAASGFGLRFVFSGTVSALPTSHIATLTAIGATFSDVIATFPPGSSTDSSTLAATLAAVGTAEPSGAITLPDDGDLCVPATITFSGGTNPTLYNDAGDVIGVQQFGVDFPVVVDTETGTAILSGVEDFTSGITGDPFFTVVPGETVYAFGGGDVQVCFRPAVLSA